MASSSNLLRVRGSGDFRQLKQELSGVRGEFDRLGKSQGAKAVLQGVGMGAGISAWNLLSQGIGRAVDLVGDSIRAASDQREAWALTQQVFQRNADAMREWADDARDAFSTTEAMQYASTFGTAFQSVGMALDEVTEKSQTMVTLAGDLGSAFNTSSEEAAAALRSGLIGESEPMRKFGVFLSEAAVSAKAAQLGMTKLGGKLSDTQKVAARYAIIMEQTAASQGMFGRDTGSLADTQKMLDNRLKDASASIGEKFMPAVQSATASLVDLLEALDNLPDPGAWWDEATQGAQDFIDTLPKSEHTLKQQQRELMKTFNGMVSGFGRATSSVESDSSHMSDALRTDARAVRSSYAKTADYLLGQYTATVDKAYGIAEARADLHAAKTNEDREQAYRDLAELGALGQKGFDNWLKVLQKMADSTKGQIREAYLESIKYVRALKAAASGNIKVSVSYKTTKPGQAAEPRAVGGPVFPYRTYTVGEAGPETLVMGQAGGYVIPHGGGAARGGSGMVPVSIPIVIDGREIARVVDRHLYYEAARAPRSSYAG